jgi:DNA-binding GntR family transcriptional regulator
MSTHKEHCEDCRRAGLSRDWAVVHHWLDAFAKDVFPSDRHRVHRHHLGGVEEVRHRWGDEAAKAAEIHILADMRAYGADRIPTVSEAQAQWGQEIIHHPCGKIEIRKRLECD